MRTLLTLALTGIILCVAATMAYAAPPPGTVTMPATAPATQPSTATGTKPSATQNAVGSSKTPQAERPKLSERQRYLLRADRIPNEALVQYCKATGATPTNAFLKMPDINEFWTDDDQFDMAAFRKWLASR